MKVGDLLKLAGPDAEIAIMEDYEDHDTGETWRAAPVDDRVQPILRNGLVILSGNPNGPFLASGDETDIIATGEDDA
jgi:hypothetical protein